jgi:carbamoylphosphate synthase small subunit
MQAQGAVGELGHGNRLGVEGATVGDVVWVTLGVGYMSILVRGDD